MLKRILSKYHKDQELVSYGGDFETWDEASTLCGSGYSSEAIFEKVKNAALAVARGEAAYERDSFLFYDKAINYNLMMYLYQILLDEGSLSICDWGGSLGSTYYQHRDLLENQKYIWTVVEQPHFVQFGKEYLEDGHLHFAENLHEIAECNCILFSSVLQYLNNYEEIISQACKKAPPYIILERTPFGSKHRICIETVHEPIYEAAYALQIFTEPELLTLFEKCGYHTIDSWHSLVDGNVSLSEKELVQFRSYIFKREK